MVNTEATPRLLGARCATLIAHLANITGNIQKNERIV